MAKIITTPIVVPEAVRRKAGLRAGQPVELRVSGRAITIVAKEPSGIPIIGGVDFRRTLGLK